jgi:hypothetical protein
VAFWAVEVLDGCLGRSGEMMSHTTSALDVVAGAAAGSGSVDNHFEDVVGGEVVVEVEGELIDLV